jgi:methionine-rich copper-binding protein CopC
MYKLSTRLKSLAILTILGGVALLVVSGVFAHPRLQESNIPAGSVLAASDVPTRLELTFNEEIDTKRSALYVFQVGPDRIVDQGDVTVEGAKLTIGLKRLEPGVYLVRWIAISPDDGGYREGTLSFAVK